MRQAEVVEKYFKMTNVNPSLIIPCGYGFGKVITGTYFLKLELTDLTNPDSLQVIMECVDKLLEHNGCRQQPRFKLRQTELGVDVEYLMCNDSVSRLSLYSVQSHPYQYPYLSVKGQCCEQS